MTLKRASIAAVAVLVLAVPIARGPAGHVAAAPPSLHWTFDGGPEGWRAVFGPGEVRVTLVRENVKVGAGALESTYAIAPHTYFAVAREVTVPDHPTIVLSFWMKSTKAGLLGMYLTERDGSAYGHPLAVPADQWKRFALTSRQFVLDASSPGNTDENGHLDVGQIAWITIADFTGLFSQERGRAAFYVDDFRITP
ncbi:MAG: hypothetical protein ACRDGN_02560 [bacterium]